MATGKKRDTPHEATIHMLERGDIFFFYRPRVEEEHPHSIDDIQRLYIVLRVEAAEKEVELKQARTEKEDEEAKGDEAGKDAKETAKDAGSSAADAGEHQNGQHKKAQVSEEESKEAEEVRIGESELLRLLIIGRKSLPDAKKRSQPFWGFVDLVTKNPEDIKKALAAVDYETSTGGERHQPAARAVGEGVYALARHKSRGQHVHLVYKLELPRKIEPEGPQAALHIEKEASYLITIKNPETPQPANVGLNKKRAAYPKSLQELFHGRRWLSPEVPDFLNFEGCEFLLMGSSDDPEHELDLELKDTDHAKDSADLLQAFGESLEDEVVVKPLIAGEWA